MLSFFYFDPYYFIVIGPFLILQITAILMDRPFYTFPYPVWALCSLAVLLIPTSFAFAYLIKAGMSIGSSQGSGGSTGFSCGLSGSGWIIR